MDLVAIRCQNGEHIYISRSTLASKSEVLNSKVQQILPLDVPADLINQLLEFIEERNPFLSSVINAIDLYHLSKSYEIDGLKSLCKEYLIAHINVDNVCRIHDFAYQNQEWNVQYNYWTLFDSRWSEIFAGEDFLRCNERTIITFLSRPKYKSLSELDLFKAVYKWVLTNFCQQKSVDPSDVMKDELLYDGFRLIMNRFLPKIRFLAMKEKELEDHVFSLGFLTDNETEAIRSKRTIGTMICSDAYKRTEVDDSKLFRYKNRHDLDHRKVNQFKFKETFISEIKVEHDCFLTHIYLPICHFSQNEIPVILERYSLSEETALSTQYLTCDRCGNVRLKEIIILEKNSRTKLTITIPKNKITKKSNIKIKPFKYYYMTDDERTVAIRQKKKWYKLYFDVELYF